jgi:dipeptidyl aminopeptidase/acylaminoacyl peptidase
VLKELSRREWFIKNLIIMFDYRFYLPFKAARLGLILGMFVAAQYLLIAAQQLTVGDIMREPSIAGQRPEAERLSPDGSKVIFLWNAEGKEPKDMYVAAATGGAPRKLLSLTDVPAPSPSPTPENKLNYGLEVRDEFSRTRENQFGGVEWSPDSGKIVFSQNGDLYTLDVSAGAAGGRPIRITRTQAGEFAPRFLDNDRILFQQNGNLFVVNTASPSLIQLSGESNPSAFISVSNASPSDDGKILVYVVSDASKQRALVIPNYIGEFVQAPVARRGWTEQKVLAVLTDGSRDHPTEIKLPKPEGASYVRSLRWAADNRSLIVDRIDRDTKRRRLFYIHNAGGKDEQTLLVTEETDDKWVASLARIVEPNPGDSGRILFASERDGFNHLYLATLERTKPQSSNVGEQKQENPGDDRFTGKVDLKQLTRGRFEVDWAKFTGHADEIVFSSTEENPAERNFYMLRGADFEKQQVFTLSGGMKTSAQIAVRGKRPTLLYEYSKWNRPYDIFALALCPGCRGLSAPVQLTKSVPPGFAAVPWIEPKFVDIPSKDGKIIKAKIYLPVANTDKRPVSPRPMVIFVHGAGYLQNTINGWNNYYREFMFNELLTQKGYVILDIDYRGSAGYGRDWRTDVYEFLGGLDMQDHLDAIDFMVKNYAVDPVKVGVYGGSYGGFMAEMLAMRAPDKIACAAVLRPVADWKNYFASSPVYTTERLGFPDKNAEAYRRSSPITYADQLRRPLLILHGLVDDNVPVQDSMQLIEKLIRLDKTPYFESMFYPSESHGFVRPSSWTDEYERILMFFDKHLK